MPTLDVDTFLTQSGVRKSRFGGFDEDDVRAAMRALCAEYDQHLNRVEGELRRLTQENSSLVQQCRTLAAQNRLLSSQNATLAGNGEQYSRETQKLNSEVNGLQQRNRSLHDQCAVLRLKNNDLADENAALKAAADQAESALRLRGKELADEIASLRASRQQKLNEASAQANAALADAHRQADALLTQAQLQAKAIEDTARQQAREQAQNLVDAAAAEANEIQNAHQLRLNELAAEVRAMEDQRVRMIAYFNKMGGELLRMGAAAQAEDPTKPLSSDRHSAAPARPDEVRDLPFTRQAPAQPPAEVSFHEIQPPTVQLDLSQAAIAAALAVNSAHAETQGPVGSEPSENLSDFTASPVEAPENPADSSGPSEQPTTPQPASTPPVDAYAQIPDNAQREISGSAVPESSGFAAQTGPDSHLGTEIDFMHIPAPDTSGTSPDPHADIAWGQPPSQPDLVPDTAAENRQPTGAAKPQPAPSAFGGKTDSDSASVYDTHYDAQRNPSAQDSGLPRQTAPGMTEVPGAIFSSPILPKTVSGTSTGFAAPVTGPRAPLLPTEEPDSAEDDPPDSGLVAGRGAPGAGAAWQRRHKAIRAIQALRRLHRG